MRLRPRLALTAAALTLPLAMASVWLEARARDQASREVLIAHVRARLEGDGARECATAAERWARPPLPFPPPFGGPPGLPPPPPSGMPPPPPFEGPPPEGAAPLGPPIMLSAYDERFAPRSPAFPPLDEAMIVNLRNGQSIVFGTFRDHDVVFDQVLVRTSVGACAFVLARRPRPPFGPDTLSSIARTWAPPVLAMLLSVALALGPIVRRIRLLAERVRASARDRYRTEIALGGDDEVAELAAAFDGAGREVRTHLEHQEKREQTLRDFLANTTHDVMTPLTVLQGHLSAMRRHLDDGAAVDRALVAAAIDETHYMAALVHNLGVAARLEAGEPHLARGRVDLGALVERIAMRHRPIGAQHGIELEHAVPEEPIVTLGDETFLEQAVSNVVYNAIAHNEPGGHVAIVLEAISSSRFRLRVLDDGPGVADDELARVVERSVRGEAARTRHPDGRGLGLAITRRVAELHHLTLRFSRAEPKGLQVDLEGEMATDDGT